MRIKQAIEALEELVEYAEEAGFDWSLDNARAALAALRSMPQGEPVGEQEPGPNFAVPSGYTLLPLVGTRPANSQEWAGMTGSSAFLLIERHADGWGDVELMMGEWLAANATPHTAPVPAEPVAQFTDRHEIAWTDKDGVHHSMGIEGARSLLGKFWDEWPGGWSEVEAEKLARATPHTEAVRMSEAEIFRWWSSENGFEDLDMCKIDDFRTMVRAVEQATAARLGVKMGDV